MSIWRLLCVKTIVKIFTLPQVKVLRYRFYLNVHGESWKIIRKKINLSPTSFCGFALRELLYNGSLDQWFPTVALDPKVGRKTVFSGLRGLSTFCYCYLLEKIQKHFPSLSKWLLCDWVICFRICLGFFFFFLSFFNCDFFFCFLSFFVAFLSLFTFLFFLFCHMFVVFFPAISITLDIFCVLIYFLVKIYNVLLHLCDDIL